MFKGGKVLCELGCACNQAAKAFEDMAKAYSRAIQNVLQTNLKNYKRVKHLALYSKKARTRKKNINRMRKAVRSDEMYL